MPVTDSPLRYPGGKTKLYKVISPIIKRNVGANSVYVEPFAGGAGLALKLLFHGDVESVVLNDIDKNIFYFWKACLQNTEALCRIIHDCIPSISLWDEQRRVYQEPEKYSELQRAFATLYLNRCNVSGIISGGPIGGRCQNGLYKIGARFNSSDLERKIQKIGQNSERIRFYNMDASLFIQEVVPMLPIDKTLINIDPPYVNKGPQLYRNSFCYSDHVQLSKLIQGLRHKWIVTYDECPLILELYGQCKMSVLELKYSAGRTKDGREYIITSDNLI